MSWPGGGGGGGGEPAVETDPVASPLATAAQEAADTAAAVAVAATDAAALALAAANAAQDTADEHITDATAAHALTAISGAGTAAFLDVGAGASQIVQRDGSGRLTGDGSLLTALPAGSTLSIVLTQVAHGFVAGDAVRHNGTVWVKAQANIAGNAEVFGVVSSAPTANTFVLVLLGRITGLSGLTAGAAHFLSPVTAGLLTSSEPTIGLVRKPLLLADSTTTGFVVVMLGVVVVA